jgi:hypothetical protein
MEVETGGISMTDGLPRTRMVHVKVKGLIEHARECEPRLRQRSLHLLGRYLGAPERSCKAVEKVPYHRRKGWEFPTLKDARAAWEKRFPSWPVAAA